MGTLDGTKNGDEMLPKGGDGGIVGLSVGELVGEHEADPILRGEAAEEGVEGGEAGGELRTTSSIIS